MSELLSSGALIDRGDVAFDPAATHPDVDRLLAHLSDDLQAWWWASLGFGLLGQPSRAFYLCVGPSNGGKTTMVNAVSECLGAVYAPRPANDALESKRTAQAGLSPELEAFTQPARWAIFDEVTHLNISTTQLKRLSGDSKQTFRRLHSPLQTRWVTASIMFVCNPGQIPRLRLQDEAVFLQRLWLFNSLLNDYSHNPLIHHPPTPQNRKIQESKGME